MAGQLPSSCCLVLKSGSIFNYMTILKTVIKLYLTLTSVKRFVHEPLTLVHAACKGQLALHPGLLYDEENKSTGRKLYLPLAQADSK